jgi:anti-anti-sigma factor
MEIVTQQLGNALEVRLKGRLANYWTEHLRRNLDEFIRAGAHGIHLNLSEISFLSSAGVGLLMRVHSQLKSIGGSLVITSPSERVKQVLDLCKLSPILLSERSPSAPVVHQTVVRHFSSPAASFEVIECAVEKPLICQRIGDPGLLKGCRFGPEDCHIVTFPPATFGLGLGAFGNDFEDAQKRFGEFLAVGGSAAYLPTDGSNVPDFMVSSGELVPEMKLLYGLRCEGGFTHQVRFESADYGNPISLADVTRTALEISGAQAIGMVMVVESAGLVGAALRRSPSAATGLNDAPFKYPEVRSWLSFSTERLYPRSLALISGIAAGSECAPLTSMLRPLAADAWPLGHFHAAAFSFRPLKKGSIDLTATVTALFETEILQGVFHLLTDNREAAGAQQSEFMRGACWFSAASEIR